MYFIQSSTVLRNAVLEHRAKSPTLEKFALLIKWIEKEHKDEIYGVNKKGDKFVVI
jgi:hypothetical protein